MREEEQKLAESYAWQAEELTRLQSMKDEAESELRNERERLKREASEAKNRLLEAKQIQHEVEQTRIESSKEAERIIQEYKETHEILQETEEQKLLAERERLESDSAELRLALAKSRAEKEEALAL